MKRSGYKYQIEQKLLNEDWEIKTMDSNFEWWDDEHWKMEYKYDSKLSFFLCFIVDPMFEKPRKKGQGIHEVKASTEFPKNWNDNEHTIASISMTKRKFEIKLAEFMNDIIEFKKEKTTANNSYK
ncbi:hypothetical protein HME9304_03216 [Flagellimonas maritima]|uniref:Uncharacterized protein n=1 Tax=Flagellimonas maritima TaxID=1383885 RepID=A0A2Z4LXC9_9FLAO|nr:hypothetical protein [Allomuricauda aurantiaca]AWX46184.1 hypothetical protein HME9304_03216 [Allomuricauda aurantiaca]